MPVRLDSIKDPENKAWMPKTPSQYPQPVFVMCPPAFVDNKIKNNSTMKDMADAVMDRPKFLAQWYNLYNVLAANSLTYLLPPKKGLQDQTYVNCFAYLPHVKNKNVIVLSNFTAEGREGEEWVAASLLRELGYEVVKCPFRFEGEPELKYLRDNIYIGGYGFRSDIRAHRWLEETFGCKILYIKETDEVLYHLDCSVLPLNDYNVIMCAELMDRKQLAEVEKYANIHPISKADAYAGAANSLKVEGAIYNSSNLAYLRRTDEEYAEQAHKNDRLQAIADVLGMEIIYFDLSECEASGAKLSCFVSHLNYIF
jgi:N-dimethylarginine dimethylaminohydrolase